MKKKDEVRIRIKKKTNKRKGWRMCKHEEKMKEKDEEVVTMKKKDEIKSQRSKDEKKWKKKMNEKNI